MAFRGTRTVMDVLGSILTHVENYSVAAPDTGPSWVLLSPVTMHSAASPSSQAMGGTQDSKSQMKERKTPLTFLFLPSTRFTLMENSIFL